MNSILALNELRTAKQKKQQEKLQCNEIKKQLEYIHALKKEKEILNSKLQLLMEGNTLEEIDESLEVKRFKKSIRLFQEKLSAYRIIGPCGLTVIEVDDIHLVVSFTARWRDLTESFILEITYVNGFIKISNTTIPYFLNIQTVLDNCEIKTLDYFLDEISYLINAYIQRKGEVEFVKNVFKDFLKTCSTNDAFTSIDLTLCHKNRFNGNSEIKLFMIYPLINSLLPSTVEISTINLNVSAEKKLELKKVLLEQQLTNVMPLLQTTLTSL
ncbi:uncharacterized protein LOC131942288 [Physella acuta]|uniref:uncharacterized protein LOC131942288 n=1 Tax=Physella acuta TaxID=109671 RepID=UPI0027DDB877|nr:uncharacterized protein LOC131942288 [Physella acuta]